MQRIMWSWTPGATVSCAALLCICCADTTSQVRGAATPLAPYSGHSAELFDDAIEPEAVGYSGGDQGIAPRNNPLLRERTQTGDAVVRARVVTITSSPEDNGHTWLIGLRRLETLAGKHAPDADFSFRVDERSPAAGLVRALEARLVGTTLVVFVREFGAPNSDGQLSGGQLHFHFAKDDAEELGAVRQASLLGDVQ
jgi:hypothetical protein